MIQTHRPVEQNRAQEISPCTHSQLISDRASGLHNGEEIVFSINGVGKSGWKWLSRVQLIVTPWTIHSMEFSRPEYGNGSLSLLQGIFPTQGSNPGLLHCRCILYQLSHKGSPRTLERVAYPFSKGSSRPRNWTRVSCIAGRFFTNWDIREAHV